MAAAALAGAVLVAGHGGGGKVESAAVGSAPIVGRGAPLLLAEAEKTAHRIVTPQTPDRAVQRTRSGVPMPDPLTTFDGQSGTGPVPPDVEGDIGPNHYVQWVNTKYAVYDRSGALLAPPAAGNSLFQSLPGGTACHDENWGDPIVLYDQLADRWVMSQFSFRLPFGTGPYYQCIAVSTTGNPLGPYCAYSFPMSTNVWNDYGKIGLWPDAYYFSFRGIPDSKTPKEMPVAWAVERQKLLTCDTAPQWVYFDAANSPALAGLKDHMLPADLDGSTLPPLGAPNPYLMSVDGSPDHLSLFEFHVDWANTAASTFTKKADLTVPAFDSVFACHTTTPPTQQCIPQAATSNRLDVLSQQLMKRLTYRRFPDHESLVVNQTVDADVDHAAVRWYELRDPNGTPTVRQASTYAPDADHRWMGSAAMDRLGDLAVGYSVSSATTHPTLRYAGRLAADPLGSLTLDETSLFAPGAEPGGSQTGQPRWGDYQSLSIDPADDCTFWFAGEYYPADSSTAWHTRIGSFRFPGCAQTTAASIRSFTARRRGGQVRLTWRTASELNLLGFNVFLSKGTGPFRKVNATLIRAHRGGTALGSSYHATNRNAPRGQVLSYRLQLVDRRGARSWYGVGVATS